MVSGGYGTADWLPRVYGGMTAGELEERLRPSSATAATHPPIARSHARQVGARVNREELGQRGHHRTLHASPGTEALGDEGEK